MIPISQIDSNLSIYKNQNVIVWGAGVQGLEIFELLQAFKIKVSYFCDNDTSKWGTTFQDIPVISPAQLLEQDNFLVQLALSAKFEKEVLLQLEELSIVSFLSTHECKSQLINYLKLNALKKNPKLSPEIISTTKISDAYLINSQKQMHLSLWKEPETFPIFVCMVQKTGDTTMLKTFEYNNVPTLQTHYSHWFKKEYLGDLGEKRVRIITALRDPISRDLSHLYQHFSIYNGFNCFFDVNNDTLDDFVTLYSSNDAQVYFDKFVKGFNFSHTFHWFSEFSANTVDLLKHPFDKEKGFSIIQEGNYDIFFYQLEKLNHIVPNLSEWVGVPFETLKNANLASEKWISNSYNMAKEKIKLTQEYVDSCYADPYVQHCYSSEDIERFKENWSKNIAD